MYQISGYANHFETAKSKSSDRRRKVVVPLKQKGLGFRRILQHPQGPALFGIFMLLVEYCSTHPAPRAGLLTDTGRPDGKELNAQDIGAMYGIDAALAQTCLDVLSSTAIGWLEVVEAGTVPNDETNMGSFDKVCNSDSEMHSLSKHKMHSLSKNHHVLEKMHTGDKGRGGTIGGSKGSEGECKLHEQANTFRLEIEEINRTNPSGCKDKKEEKVDLALKQSYELFAKYYNMILEQTAIEGEISAMKASTRWSDQRARKWAARCREPEFRANNSQILRKAFASDFLTGRRQVRGREPFVLSIDWLIKNNTNYVKVLDGYYDNRPAKSGNLSGKNYDGEL
jgi:hypothetical protein